MYKSDIVFLLGAGASIPTGVPGMANMAKNFSKQHSKNKNIKSGFDILSKLSGSTDLEDLLQLSNSIIDFKNNALNNYVKYCLTPRGENKTLTSFNKRCDESIQIITNFKYELTKYISQTCLQFDVQKAEKIFGRILPVLASRNIPIFTTNYDTVIERIANNNSIPLIDNFVQDKIERYFWDNELKSFHGKGLKLIKIHGSILWHSDPNGKIEKLRQPAPFNQEGLPLEQLLIFPTRFKDIYTKNYFPLYSSFTRTLGSSKVLFVIGHSLRDEYLLAAIREKLRDDNFYLIIIDPHFPAKDELLASKNKGVSERIIHISHGIQEIHLLLLQTLQIKKVYDIVTILRNATIALSKNKKDKIELKEVPTWCSRGDTIEFKVKINTILADYKIGCWILLNKEENNWKKHELTDIHSKIKYTNVIGCEDILITSNIKIPKNIEFDSTKLHVDIRNKNDKVIAKDVKVIRFKKAT